MRGVPWKWMEPLLGSLREAVLEPLVDPRPLGIGEWQLIARLLYHLFFFTGLALAGVLALLLGHGVIPSPVLTAATESVPRAVVVVRWVLYPVAAVNLALAAWLFWRVVVLARVVLLHYWPRFLI